MEAKLEKCVEKVVEENKHVLSIVVGENGSIVFSGDNQWIDMLEQNVELRTDLETKLKENIQEDFEELEKASLPRPTVVYDKLPADIYRPKTPQNKIRDTLNKMLQSQGFGKKKYKRSVCKITSVAIIFVKGNKANL
jgi:hypothetical protein